LPDLRDTALPDLHRNAGIDTITATSLDDPSQFKPQALTYSVGGHAWDPIDPSVQAFERMARG